MEESVSERTTGRKILKGTIVIILVSVFAKITAFFSEALLANYLGTSYQSDAYYMVSSIQQVFYPMLSVGVWKVFLPVYKDRITQKKMDEASAVANKTITLLTIVSILFVVFIWVFNDVVVRIIAPGFSDETRVLCAELVRISSPMYLFVIIAAVYASMLQCHNKFWGSQIREVATHIPTILVAILCYNVWGVKALAVALILGGLVRLLVELPFVDWGYRFRPDFSLKDTQFIVMIKRLPSALLSEGVTQFNTLIDKVMASSLPTGAVSSLNYGHRLMNVFSGLLSSAIATAMYPQMVELISLKKQDVLAQLMEKTIRLFFITMVPISIACIVFRTELVTLVYQRGAFGTDSTIITSSVFALYSVGLLFVACSTVLNNLFYGYGDTKTPMIISVVHLIVNVVLNLVLVWYMGVNGLALATSLSAIVTTGVRYVLCGRYIIMNGKVLLYYALKIGFVSCFSCIGAYLLVSALFDSMLVRLVIGAVLGVSSYCVLLKVLHVDELNELIKIIRRKK